MSQTIKNCCSLWSKVGLLLLILPMLLLAGCSDSGTTQSTTLRIGVAIYDQSDSFISTICQDMERMAREIEVEENIKITLSMLDGRSNPTIQMDQIDQFITQKCDAICVNVVDRTAASVLIDKAEAADIPIIFFNRQPVDEDMERWDGVYYVGAEAQTSGQLQGEIVRDLWQSRQSEVDKNGDGVLQYVMLEGEQGHQDTLLRTKYSVKELVEAEIPVEKLAGATANWSRGQASEKMSQWLGELETPPEVVFANNDDMALGAIDTYLAEGYAPSNLPVVVGVDALPDALVALNAGTLAGTVLNDGEGIACNMLDLSLALWRGDDPATAVNLVDGNFIWLDYVKMTGK